MSLAHLWEESGRGPVGDTQPSEGSGTTTSGLQKGHCGNSVEHHLEQR